MTGILVVMVTLVLVESGRQWWGILTRNERSAGEGISVCEDAVGGGTGMKQCSR